MKDITIILQDIATRNSNNNRKFLMNTNDCKFQKIDENNNRNESNNIG